MFKKYADIVRLEILPRLDPKNGATCHTLDRYNIDAWWECHASGYMNTKQKIKKKEDLLESFD